MFTPFSVLLASIVVLLLLMYIVASISRHQKKKRTLWLRAFAKAIGFSFVKIANPDFIYGLTNFVLFGQEKPVWHVRNLMNGKNDDVFIQIFDYRYYFKSPGEGGGGNRQTVVVFTSDRIQLPHFALRPKNATARQHPQFGDNHIRLNQNSRFDQAYFLQGEDETAVRALFDDELCEHYGHLLTKSSEGKDNTLIYYYADHLIVPELMDEFLEEAMQAFNLFAAKSKLVSILKQNNQLR
jgi:hypothetical protein